jgi:ABC-type branched-subunit amino acid transport system ATPase component
VYKSQVLVSGKGVLTGPGKELAADGRVQRAYLGME